MFRNHQQSFTIFFYICFLSVSLTSSPSVTVTLGQAYETETTTTFRSYGVEDFDTVAPKWHEKYVSMFNSSGYQSLSRGSYNDWDTDGYIQGYYTGLEVAKNDAFGGVGPTGVNYARIWYDCDLKLTKTPPWGVNYFGFHGEALSYRNRVEFYFGNDMIFELKMDDIINILANVGKSTKKPKYLYNPNPKFEVREQLQPFVFVNVYFDGARFDNIKFRTRWIAIFEMDIHTVGSYISQDGIPIPVTTSYIEPKNKIPELPELPEYPMPKIPSASAHILYEEPGETDSSFYFRWFVYEDFNSVSEGQHSDSYVSHFRPKGRVQGTYSAPFDIIQKNCEKYFSTTDSLLNLTVTPTGTKGASLFGLYLNPLNRHGSLEFFLSGESIFVFYLVDVFDFVQNKPGYFGDPELQPGDKASTDGFIFINIMFSSIIYDAVRFRNWENVGGGVTSDYHVIGEWSDHSAKWLQPFRTILKVKKSLADKI